MVPYVKNISFGVAFCHIFFHDATLRGYLSSEIHVIFGDIQVKNPYSITQLLVVIMLFVVNCSISRIRITLWDDFKCSYKDIEDVFMEVYDARDNWLQELITETVRFLQENSLILFNLLLVI